MDREQIRLLLASKNILNKNGKRKHNWKKLWDDECETTFEEFAKSYRSHDEAWFCMLHDIEPCHCMICGKLAKFNNSTRSLRIGYNTTCEKCSANAVEEKLIKFKKYIQNRSEDEINNINEKRKNTNIEKYGDPLYMCYGTNSFKDNMVKKYDNQYYNNRDKYRQTMVQKYGVDHNFKLIPKEQAKCVWDNNYDEIISKIKRTNTEKYGAPYVGQVKEIVDKMISTKKQHIHEFEVANNCTLEKTVSGLYGQGWKNLHLEKIRYNGWVFISNDDIELIKEYSKQGHLIRYYSNKERDLSDYIKSIYKGRIIENDCSTVRSKYNRFYELDIYLPDLKMAFEFNGDYWHSSLKKHKEYHHDKTKSCYEQGVQLVNIYEYMWDDEEKYNIKQRILSLLSDKYSCMDINWIPLCEYRNYILTQPNAVYLSKKRHVITNFNNKKYKYLIYDEGTFAKKPEYQ